MKKKGFTLIELLAVIVILAIIALIAVPIVLNIINNSKESARIRSVEMYVDAVQQTITRKNLSSAYNPSSCTVQSNGNLLCLGDTNELVIEVDGEKPTGGRITLTDGKITGIQLYYGEEIIVKDNEGNIVQHDPTIQPTEPGLYDSNNLLLATWDELVNDYKINIEADYKITASNMPSNIINIKFPTGVKLIIGGSPTRIGKYAFAGQTNLTSIELPEGVKSIESQAFFLAANLKSITIPSTLTSVNGSSFAWCDNLETIIVDENNTVYNDGNNGNAIIETATNTLVVGSNNTVIPNSVTSIAQNAFFGRILTSIELPNSIKSIGQSAFAYCEKLTNIEIPSSVTNIENSAFQFCTSLSSLEIPGSVKIIGDDAFNGCEGLTSLTINSGVTSIGFGTFMGCSSLTSVSIPSSVTTIDQQAFYDCTNLATVYFNQTTTPTFGFSCFDKSSGVVTTFYFKNSTVYNAFSSNSYHYNATYGTKSTNYSW